MVTADKPLTMREALRQAGALALAGGPPTERGCLLSDEALAGLVFGACTDRIWSGLIQTVEGHGDVWEHIRRGYEATTNVVLPQMAVQLALSRELLGRLVEATGRPADDLLREVVEMYPDADGEAAQT